MPGLRKVATVNEEARFAKLGAQIDTLVMKNWGIFLTQLINTVSMAEQNLHYKDLKP